MNLGDGEDKASVFEVYSVFSKWLAKRGIYAVDHIVCPNFGAECNLFDKICSIFIRTIHFRPIVLGG